MSILCFPSFVKILQKTLQTSFITQHDSHKPSPSIYKTSNNDIYFLYFQKSPFIRNNERIKTKPSLASQTRIFPRPKRFSTQPSFPLPSQPYYTFDLARCFSASSGPCAPFFRYSRATQVDPRGLSITHTALDIRVAYTHVYTHNTWGERKLNVYPSFEFLALSCSVFTLSLYFCLFSFFLILACYSWHGQVCESRKVSSTRGCRELVFFFCRGVERSVLMRVWLVKWILTPGAK